MIAGGIHQLDDREKEKLRLRAYDGVFFENFQIILIKLAGFLGELFLKRRLEDPPGQVFGDKLQKSRLFFESLYDIVEHSENQGLRAQHGLGIQGGVSFRQQLGSFAGDQFVPKFAFVLEIEIECSLCQPCFRDNVGDCGFCKAFFCKQTESRAEQCVFLFSFLCFPFSHTMFSHGFLPAPSPDRQDSFFLIISQNFSEVNREVRNKAEKLLQFSQVCAFTAQTV